MNAGQLRTYVVQPALKAIGLWNPVAENLVYGTGSQESGRWTWIDQTTPGPGPAYGPWQMEEETFNTHMLKLKAYALHEDSKYKDLLAKVNSLRIGDHSLGIQELHGNWFFAAAMCRIHYLLRSPALPDDPENIEELARFWKQYYNTSHGKGTVAEFIGNYR